MRKVIPKLTEEQLSRFFNSFLIKDESECWSWLEAVRNKRAKEQVPVFRMNGTNFIASRISYFVFRKKDQGSFLVCHTCNYYTCVNPNHLYLGTYKSNYADMVKAGTTPILHEGKLTESERREILQGDVSELARRFSISDSTIYYWRKKMAHEPLNLGPKSPN